MAQITISCSIPADDAEAAQLVHKYVGWPVARAARMLRMGEKGCFYSCPLFFDDHARKSRDIRRMLAFFERKGIPLSILKIGAQDSWY